MRVQSIFVLSGFLLLYVFLLWFYCSNVQAESPPSDSIHAKKDGLLTRALKEIGERLPGFRVYWLDGLRMDGRKENIRIRIGGRLMLDSGYIGADSDLKKAFPDLEGYDTDLRQLRLSAIGTIYDVAKIKFEIDFARIDEIKDIWLGLRVPYLGQLKVGHFKEPFSLEELTSLKYISFMERSLPTLAIAPGRDIGIMCGDTAFGERMTWAVGAFLVAGSFGSVGEATDRLTNAFGYSVTGRTTGLPYYLDGGRRLLHLGVSFSHQNRDQNRDDSRLRLSALPETFLTDKRLVDTEPFFTSAVNLVNSELAVVSGPLSFQGELFQAFTDADAVGDPHFWGFYLYLSYFITGEHRNYDTAKGVFLGIRPRHNFHPFQGNWGALEVGLRFSYLDLNDGDIKGGREKNFTAGLNWYLNPNVRLMFNYIRANVEDRAGPPVNDGTANIFQGRFQIHF